MIEGLTEGATVEIFCYHAPTSHVLERFTHITDVDGNSTWFSDGAISSEVYAPIVPSGHGIDRVRLKFICPVCGAGPEVRGDQLDHILQPYVGTSGVSRLPLVLLDRMLGA